MIGCPLSLYGGGPLRLVRTITCTSTSTAPHTVCGSSRTLRLVAGAAPKGFGQSVDKSEDEYKKKGGSGKKSRKERPVASVPNQQERLQQAGPQYSVDSLQQQNAPATQEDLAFAARLAEVKATKEAKAKLVAAQGPNVLPALGQSPFLLGGPSINSANYSSGGKPGSRGERPAAFDGNTDIYANPPSLAQTLMGSSSSSSIADAKLRDAPIGPSQFSLAAGAVVLVVIFLVVAGGEYAPSSRPNTARPSSAPPDPIEAKLLRSRAATFEDQMKANPMDTEALEGLAVTYTELFEFGKAAELLDKLAVQHPTDASVWRLLGETRMLTSEPSKAVRAYERGLKLQPGDATIISGLCNAYAASGAPAKAADLLLALRAEEAADVAAGIIPSTSGYVSAPAAAAPATQRAASGAVPAATAAKVAAAVRKGSFEDSIIGGATAGFRSFFTGGVSAAPALVATPIPAAASALADPVPASFSFAPAAVAAAPAATEAAVAVPVAAPAAAEAPVAVAAAALAAVDTPAAAAAAAPAEQAPPVSRLSQEIAGAVELPVEDAVDIPGLLGAARTLSESVAAAVELPAEVDIPALLRGTFINQSDSIYADGTGTPASANRNAPARVTPFASEETTSFAEDAVSLLAAAAGAQAVEAVAAVAEPVLATASEAVATVLESAAAAAAPAVAAAQEAAAAVKEAAADFDITEAAADLKDAAVAAVGKGSFEDSIIGGATAGLRAFFSGGSSAAAPGLAAAPVPAVAGAPAAVSFPKMISFAPAAATAVRASSHALLATIGLDPALASAIAGASATAIPATPIPAPATASARAEPTAASGGAVKMVDLSSITVTPPAKPTYRKLEPVSRELLLAKIYNNWRGHDSDALAVYDNITRMYPEDYRGYLAKGMFMKEKGRKADADRMFLQARFYAPAIKQTLVRELSGSNPVVELPE
ncbi:MAG: hypothetical protein WDW36_000779 [Sanguina aurantia]